VRFGHDAGVLRGQLGERVGDELVLAPEVAVHERVLHARPIADGTDGHVGRQALGQQVDGRLQQIGSHVVALAVGPLRFTGGTHGSSLPCMPSFARQSAAPATTTRSA